jgi:hypothetical protein
MARPSCFNIDGGLSGDAVLLPFTWMELFFTNVMFLTLEIPEKLAAFLSKVN